MSDFTRHLQVHWYDCDPASLVFHSHYIRWMDEGFDELAHARGVDLIALRTSVPGFRGAPLVNVVCAFRAPARYGDTLEHRIKPPVFGDGRSFRLAHAFYKNGTLVAEGEQVRVWGMVGPDGEGLRAVPVPPDIAARLRGEG